MTPPSGLHRSLLLATIALSASPLLAQSSAPPRAPKNQAELDLPRVSPTFSLRPSHRARLYWNQPFEPLSNGEKARYFVRATAGPFALGRALLSTGISHWNDSPEEWGGGMEGYGRRFAARMGHRGVRRSVQYAIGVWRNEDPRFFASGETGFLRRFGHVVKNTVVVRADDGGSTFAAGRIIGAYAGAYTSTLWLPESRNGLGKAASRGSMVLAGNFSSRLFREFWPEIRRTVFRRKDGRLPVGAVDEASARPTPSRPPTWTFDVGFSSGY